MTTELNTAFAMLTVRLIAGMLFFFQGYDKVFKVGMAEIRTMIKATMESRPLPDSLIGPLVLFTSWAELICGFLLILGFFKYIALYILCIELVIVVFAFSYAKPMWENSHLVLRLILVITLLLAPLEWDRFAIDYLFSFTKVVM